MDPTAATHAILGHVDVSGANPDGCFNMQGFSSMRELTAQMAVKLPWTEYSDICNLHLHQTKKVFAAYHG